jgi:hypothetical protein
MSNFTPPAVPDENDDTVDDGTDREERFTLGAPGDASPDLPTGGRTSADADRQAAQDPDSFDQTLAERPVEDVER